MASRHKSTLVALVSVFFILYLANSSFADHVPATPANSLTVCSSGCSYTSLQDAINAAVPGTHHYIEVIGNFSTGFIVDASKPNLVIEGMGQWVGLYGGSARIGIYADNTTVRRFWATGADTGNPSAICDELNMGNPVGRTICVLNAKNVNLSDINITKFPSSGGSMPGTFRGMRISKAPNIYISNIYLTTVEGSGSQVSFSEINNAVIRNYNTSIGSLPIAASKDVNFTNGYFNGYYLGLGDINNSYFGGSTFLNGAYGIQTAGEDLTLQGNTYSGVSDRAIYNGATAVRIENENIKNSAIGIYTEGVNTNINVSGTYISNSGRGILLGTANSRVFNTTIEGGANTQTGIEAGSNLVIDSAHLLGFTSKSTLPIKITGGSVTVKNTNISNSAFGINVTGNGAHLFTNNYLNASDAPASALSCTSCQWNTAKTAGTNIIGGPFTGGNYWSKYTGSDTNGDGLGDTLVPYTADSNIAVGDSLPLTTPSSWSIPTIYITTANNTRTTNKQPPIQFYFTDGDSNSAQVTLYLNEQNVSYDGYVANNTPETLTSSAPLADGQYNVWVRAYDTAFTNNVSLNYSITIDNTAPQSITNLAETATAENSITWSWANPTDSDFNHAEVWLNGTFKTNVSSPSISIAISSLSASTIYEIELRPVDNLGNIGLWTNDTAKTNVAPVDTGGNNNGGGGGGGGSSGPTCKENEIVQNGKCVSKPQNKTIASNTGTTTVNVLPTPVQNNATENPESNQQNNLAQASAPTGFLVFDKLKNPYVALLFAGILFASLTAYAIHSGKLKAPKVPKLSMPEIKLPKLKLEPKPQTASRKPPTKFEFPKFNLPKFKAPEFSFPKFSMPKLPQLKIEKKLPPAAPQTKVVFKPNIFVKTPQIDYKKLARELKPTIESKRETRKEDFLLIPEKLSRIPEMPLDKTATSAPPRSKPIPLNEHMKSLLSGIGETEDEIMRTILMHGGRTTMARIFHETGIPPTTLLRWIVSIENRGLIKSIRLGKLRRVELTDKFTKGNAN